MFRVFFAVPSTAQCIPTICRHGHAGEWHDMYVVLVEDRVVNTADLQLVSLEIGNDWRFLGRQLGCSDAVTLNAHTLCALRSLRAHGLREKGIKEVFRSVVLTWLLYSSPSWWSFAGSKKLQIIDGFHDAAPRPISDLLIYLPSY